jgi:hypothetical protein
VGLGFVIAESLLKVVVQDPKKAVSEVADRGVAGVALLAPSVVVGAGYG